MAYVRPKIDNQSVGSVRTPVASGVLGGGPGKGSRADSGSTKPKIAPKDHGRNARVSPVEDHASLNRAGKSVNNRQFGGHVREGGFGYKFAVQQDPDELYDPNQAQDYKDGSLTKGRGARGSGSQMTPQIKLMTTGSGTRRSKIVIGSTGPKNTQKLRG